VPTTIFSSLPEYLIASLIIALAQAVYVLFGFGAGLIAVGGLALVFPEIQDVVVLLLLVNLPAELFVVSRNLGVISWRGVLRICIGIVVGIPIGTQILRVAEPTLILLILGACLVLVGLVFARLPDRPAITWPAWTAPPVGLLSGLLTGLFGTGGPPLIVYYHLTSPPKAFFRGNLMAIFLLKTFVRVPAYAVGGLISLPRLWSGLAVMPAVLLGAWIGNRIHVEVEEATFRRLVSVALILIGALLLLRRLGPWS